jgi:Sec-independent protein translocase protein TatA
MGLGTEIGFLLFLGLVVLGPKRMQTVLGDMARAKAKFEEASRGLKSQLIPELEATSANRENDDYSRRLAADDRGEPGRSN